MQMGSAGASRTSLTQEVEGLLTRGIRIDATNAAGYTPLLAAVASGRFDVVRLLIVSAADVIRSKVSRAWPERGRSSHS